MTSAKVKDFQNVINKRKAELEKLKATFKEQAQLLESIKREFESLNIDTSKLPPLESLPQELKDQYEAFARELKRIDELIAPKHPKSTGAKMRRRMTI